MKAAPIDIVVDKYVDGISKIYRIGGIPLTLLTLAILIPSLVGYGASQYQRIDNVAEQFGTSLYVCGVMIILSVVVYIYQTYNKIKIIRISLDHHNQLALMLWKEYLTRADGPLTEEKMRTAMQELGKMLEYTTSKSE